MSEPDLTDMLRFLGTRGRIRTGTPFTARDFKSPVSTIPPRGPSGRQYPLCGQSKPVRSSQFLFWQRRQQGPLTQPGIEVQRLAQDQLSIHVAPESEQGQRLAGQRPD